ncbi:autotransporter domain-containing protein [Luteimonas salinilitoris]|uniref:Autotransporter domain-containing protein n=1 Tax=Luteimonas salinilitoris TaxID=3237697 RepID=A0ABV4HQ80_9GAMM
MTNALAGNFHVNGDTVYYSGGVLGGDPDTLSQLLAQAEAENRAIRRVVFRNSPGGAASGGVGMGGIIREAGLDTVLEGGCWSACADAFAGGVNRFIARFDLPAYSYYSETALGIHGAASGGRPVPYPGQEIYLDYYREMLGDAGWEIAGDRVTQAHYELTQSSGFLRYFDPAFAGVATRFCPTGDTSEAGGCTDYPDDTIFSDTLATSDEYAIPNDALVVDARLGGDLNPHFMAPGRYASDRVELAYFDTVDRRFSLEDAYGVIRIEEGGHWQLDTASAAQYVVVDGGTLQLRQDGWIHMSEAIGARNGGRVVLDGGALRTLTIVDRGGALTGAGTLNATIMIGPGGTLAPHRMVMQPYSLEPLATNGEGIFRDEPFRIGKGRILNVLDGGNLAFGVSASTVEPALVLEQARYFLFDTSFGDITLRGNHNKAQLAISPGSRLALQFERGFFSAGHTVPLVGNRVDDSALWLPEAPCTRSDWRAHDYSGLDCTLVGEEGLTAAAPDIPFIDGRFQAAVRADDPIYSVDLTREGAVFRPRHNSLLSFMVHQTDEAIWLTANPAFDDTSIFANAQSGDGLGIALRNASEKAGSPLQPILGALQFADRDVAKAQSGALRGDGHASLRMAGLALVGGFGDVVGQRLFSVRNRGEDGGGLAAFGAYSSGAGALAGTNGIRFDRLIMHLADPGAGGAEAGIPADGARVWGRGFGQIGQLDGEGRIAPMDYNIGGAVLGADKTLADGKVVLGGSVGFGSMSATTRALQFRGEVDAIDLGAYLDADYGRGFVNLSLRYTDLKHDTTRSIVGIEGLEAANGADYGGDALSARLEHGFTLRSAGGTVWQPLLPVVDYARLSEVDFTEDADGAAPLTGTNGDVESLRVGAGLQVWKSFRTKGGDVLTPHARVLWQKELGDSQVRYFSAFAAEPELTFGVASQDIGDTAMGWNIGMTSRASDRLSVLLDYVGQRTDGSTDHGVMLGVGYRF